MSSTIYARVSAEAKAWLDEQHQRTGIPMAKLIDTILLDARRRNVAFEVRSPVLVAEPERVQLERLGTMIVRDSAGDPVFVDIP